MNLNIPIKMQGRTNDLLHLRPDIKTTTIKSIMSDEERFQNTVLRPIIKFQNDLFIEMFSNYIVKRKNVFFDLSLEKRVLYIENAIVKDMKFRNSLKGVIIGLFTVDEYKQYIKNSSALNKRMMNITKERLISNVQVFSPSTFIG